MKKTPDSKPLTANALDRILNKRLNEALDRAVEMALKRQVEYIDLRIEVRLDKFRFEIKDMFTEMRSEFFNKVDPFLREIEIAREDREIAAHKMEKTNTTLTNHEHRLRKLESPRSEI